MKSRGFSLIELVVVMVLISLSIALVAPSFSRFSKRVELKTTAQRISGILRYFRSESIQSGKVYQILLDPVLREVNIQVLEGEEEGATERQKDGQKFSKRSYPLPAGIQMKEFNIPAPEYPSDLPTIEFYPNGATNGGSFILEAQDQRGYRIKVYFLTGIVEIEEI
jgi:prepilin-type N-terminal cleavage/methylation domain-containing protein